MAMAKRSGSSKRRPLSRVKAERGAARSGGSRTSRRRLPALRRQLERAAAGLLHMSESDFPFRFFSLPADGASDLTPRGFIVRLGVSEQFIGDFNVPVDQLVEERTLAGFFPNAGDASEVKRFQRLEALLRKRLRGVKVLRVGQVEIRCYIAGFDEHGDIAGLVTTAIET